MKNLSSHPKLVVFTGAGLSVESGLKAFRIGIDPLWEGYKVEEVCDIYTWKKNREAVHSFYNKRREDAFKAQPNDAHKALANWQKLYGSDRVLLMTQNVDDLLTRAGAEHVFHLHGRLNWMYCTACGNRWHHGPSAFDHENDRCPKCTSKKGVKPDVVFFGEEAPEYRNMNNAIKHLKPNDTVVIMGTSCQVIKFDELLKGIPCNKAINSLNPITELGERVIGFDMVLGMTATEAISRLDPWIKEKMDNYR